MKTRGTIALWAIAALQAIVAIVFSVCFLLDAMGMEPDFLIWQSHEYQQTVLAIGLNFGVALGWIALRTSLQHARLPLCRLFTFYGSGCFVPKKVSKLSSRLLQREALPPRLTPLKIV